LPASVAEVAVPLPLPGSFHYLIPDSLRGRVSVGHAVQVPFGRRRLTGYVLALCEEAPGERELRPLSSLAQPEPLFPESLVELYRWIAHYYAHPLGDVVKTALPGSTRSASKKMVRLSPGGAPPELLPSEEFAGLLDRLRSSAAPALALQSLQRRDGIPAALVSRAARRGLVEIFQQDAAAVVQPRSEERFALKVSASAARDAFPRPGPVRDRLIDWLERFGPVSRSTLKEAFPTGTAALRQLRERDVLEVTEVPVDPLAAERVTILDSDRVVPPPTEAQAAALQQLLPALEQRSFRSVLLHGVTGSGKTEVYLQLAARVLQDGGSALLLVPEIGLTPQFLARFRARFGDEVVAVLHSGLSPRERFDEWMRIRHGKARLVVGPRSAVFAPVEGLRLVVVDEEHDGSYKQETGLRYSARDLALVRCRQAGALCLLGSATPSLESIHGSIEGRLELLELPVRVQGRDLPSI